MTTRSLHERRVIESDRSDIEEVYFNKTIERVSGVSKIIPNIDKKSITVNGKKCDNIFLEPEKLKDLVDSYLQPQNFYPIHGDPTFSNSIIDNNLKVWFIDPRGYFNKPGIYGDRMYDFAKLYYSAVGGYDNFNRRKFKLHVDSETVEVIMDKPPFANDADALFTEYFGSSKAKIEIIHGLIWLSLSGYAKDDIDSVIGSFYMGLYWLENGLKRL